MTGAIAVLRIPDDHTWLRVADTTWSDPLDPSWAATFGGRWNAAGSFPVLYVNEDLATARAQIH
ncbi:MAG TPA: RES domain-containing protein, partial [Acidimicrobiales bacterium]